MVVLSAIRKNSSFRTALVLGAAIGVSACSSIVEGTSQEIAISTSPSGADCALEREGITIARVNPTPGATFGNIILGGGVGWIIDSASGADNKYTSPVNIPLVPLNQPAPAPLHSPSGNADEEAEKSKPTS